MNTMRKRHKIGFRRNRIDYEINGSVKNIITKHWKEAKHIEIARSNEEYRTDAEKHNNAFVDVILAGLFFDNSPEVCFLTM